MLSPDNPVPQIYWDLAMTYACDTASYNFSKVIGTSPYMKITGLSGLSIATFVLATITPTALSATPPACLSLDGVRSSWYPFELTNAVNSFDV